ncbi:transposase [Azotobacter armeniacus]
MPVLDTHHLCGVAPVIAVSIVAEIGDFSRFESPRDLMAYLGQVPGEHSSGASIRPRGITRQDNRVLPPCCTRWPGATGSWRRSVQR